MRSSFIAIVLYIFAAAAGAQCAGQQSLAGAASAPKTPVAHQQSGTELIKISTGRPGSEQALPADDGIPSVHETTAAAKPAQEPERPAGPAMMLAAVAVMSGIALRRYGAPR
jgi:hypothetical protein